VYQFTAAPKSGAKRVRGNRDDEGTRPHALRQSSVEKLPQNKHFVLVLFLLPDRLVAAGR
jgi:hypothetical protein